MASKVAHKSSYHILMCGTQLKTAYENDQMQISRKKLRNHRSVNTNIERKLKALELRFVWVLKHPFVPF